MENGGDHGRGEDEPDNGDAFEEPVDGLQHEISKENIVSGVIGAEREFLEGRKDRYDVRITIWKLGALQSMRRKAFVLTRVGVGNILRGEEA